MSPRGRGRGRRAARRATLTHARSRTLTHAPGRRAGRGLCVAGRERGRGAPGPPRRAPRARPRRAVNSFTPGPGSRWPCLDRKMCVIGFKDGAVAPAGVSSSRGAGGLGGARLADAGVPVAPREAQRAGRAGRRPGWATWEGDGTRTGAGASSPGHGWGREKRAIECSSGFSQKQTCVGMRTPAGPCPSRFVPVLGSPWFPVFLQSGLLSQARGRRVGLVCNAGSPEASPRALAPPRPARGLASAPAGAFPPWK